MEFVYRWIRIRRGQRCEELDLVIPQDDAVDCGWAPDETIQACQARRLDPEFRMEVGRRSRHQVRRCAFGENERFRCRTRETSSEGTLSIPNEVSPFQL